MVWFSRRRAGCGAFPEPGSMVAALSGDAEQILVQVATERAQSICDG